MNNLLNKSLKLVSETYSLIIASLLVAAISMPSHAAIIFSEHYSLTNGNAQLSSRAIDLAKKKEAIKIEIADWSQFKELRKNCDSYVSIIDQFFSCSVNPIYSNNTADG